MKNSPCHNCPRRCFLCHAHCPDYPKWVDELKRERTIERKADDADAHTKNTIEKNFKRSQSKRRVGQR